MKLANTLDNRLTGTKHSKLMLWSIYRQENNVSVEFKVHAAHEFLSF